MKPERSTLADDYVPPTPQALASWSGSPAHACPHNVKKNVECGKPVTHRVTRDGTNLEWVMCEEHARQRKSHLYTVTALENAKVSNPAAENQKP